MIHVIRFLSIFLTCILTCILVSSCPIFSVDKHQTNTKLRTYDKTGAPQALYLQGLWRFYNGAGNGIRTRDFRLGKPTLYR